MTPVTDPLTDEEMPRARLGVLLQHFSELDDDREPWRVMYPLKEVLLLVTCATIASCDDFDDIVAWGKHHLDALRRFSTFHHGIPCERWLRALVNRIDPILFGRCFESWVAAQWPGRHEFIALDGKTSRRTHDKCMERLREAGVKTTYRCHSGMIHLFYGMGGLIPYVATAYRQMGTDIRSMLGETAQ